MSLWKRAAQMPNMGIGKHNASFLRDEQSMQRARDSAQEGLMAGLKSAAITGAVTAVPVLLAGQKLAWVRRNLNYTAQALIICSASMAAYYIVSDHTILERARSSSYSARRTHEAYLSGN